MKRIRIDGEKLRADLKALNIRKDIMCEHISFHPTSLCKVFNTGGIIDDNLDKILSYMNKDKMIWGRFMYRPLKRFRVEDYIIKK